MSNKNYESHIKEVKKQLTDCQIAGLRAMGKLAAKEVRLRAPRRTGNLKKNIRYKVTKKDKTLKVGVKGKAWYAALVEKGTSNTAAQPFLMPAIEENINALREAEANAIREGMVKLGYVPNDSADQDAAEGSE